MPLEDGVQMPDVELSELHGIHVETLFITTVTDIAPTAYATVRKAFACLTPTMFIAE